MATGSCEALADRITTIAAVVGAVFGAIAGVALGAIGWSDDPCAGGTLTITLGSLVAAIVGRSVIVPMWSLLVLPRVITQQH